MLQSPRRERLRSGYLESKQFTWHPESVGKSALVNHPRTHSINPQVSTLSVARRVQLMDGAWSGGPGAGNRLPGPDISYKVRKYSRSRLAGVTREWQDRTFAAAFALWEQAIPVRFRHVVRPFLRPS